MTRIELGPIPPKVCQCEFCGRIRCSDGLWIWDDSVQPDVLGFCGLCGKSRKDAADKRRVREAKDVEHRAAIGKLRAKLPADPFQGFREKEGE